MKSKVIYVYFFLPLQKRMRAHILFEGNFVLLLHGAAILSTAYDI